MKFQITGRTEHINSLIATPTAAGGLVVRAEDSPKGVPARRIAPSTVTNKGGYIEALRSIYLTGINKSYYSTVTAI
jgi:hypothetical protein